MKQIEPVSLWVNGQQKVATNISLKSVNDNLKDSAVFYYSLVAKLLKEDGSEFKESLVQGNLSISGQEYIDWGIQTDINLWAYQWAAAQLNLVLVLELEQPTFDTEEKAG